MLNDEGRNKLKPRAEAEGLLNDETCSHSNCVQNPKECSMIKREIAQTVSKAEGMLNDEGRSELKPRAEAGRILNDKT